MMVLSVVLSLILVAITSYTSGGGCNTERYHRGTRW
jgi:hypothetical protein